MIKDDNEADGDPAGSDSGAGLSSSSHVESGGGGGVGGVGGGGRGGGHGSLRIKGEAVFVPRPSTATGSSTTKGGGYSAVPNAVMDVQEKGSKGFTVQTVSQGSFFFFAFLRSQSTGSSWEGWGFTDENVIPIARDGLLLPCG